MTPSECTAHISNIRDLRSFATRLLSTVETFTQINLANLYAFELFFFNCNLLSHPRYKSGRIKPPKAKRSFLFRVAYAVKLDWLRLQ